MRLSHASTALALVLGATVLAAGGCVTPDYPDRAFRCNPRQKADACPDGYVCCSDDPAALSMGGVRALPSYPGVNNNPGVVTLFSAGNNDESVSGLCIAKGNADQPQQLQGPAAGCPVPCNPKWSGADIAAVCGANTLCCQTDELGPQDCVIDPQTNCWRPVRITDVPTLSNWTAAEHDTNQDPGGRVCARLTSGQAQSVFNECIASLTVADQRGICLQRIPGVVEACPTSRPDYLDACRQRNLAEGRNCP